MIEECKEVTGSIVVKRILAYLLENPDAGGTVESIVEWWLTQNEVDWRVKEVQGTLRMLVSEGWICERSIPWQVDAEGPGFYLRECNLKDQGKEKRSIYKVNKQKLQEIESFLKSGMGKDG